MVCTAMPPAPGCQRCPLAWRNPGSSFHVLPPSVVLKIAASSTPAYAVSASVSDGSMCHTRLNSHGCCEPSYHLCVVSGLPVSAEASYTNLLLSPFGIPPGPVVASPGGVPG